MKNNKSIFQFLLIPWLALSSMGVVGATLTLKFYDASSNALSFSQVQTLQIGPGVGAYEADAFVDPVTLKMLTATPMTDAGSLTFNLPGQSAAFAINWPTTPQGYGSVIVDNGGIGFNATTNVNFTYQASKDIKRRLDLALAGRPDYVKSTAFNAAYNAASNSLSVADASAADADKGAQGQLALNQLVVAYDLLLKEYGPVYAKAHQTASSPWLGFTIEDIGNYQSDLDKLAAMAGTYAWVRVVFQPANQIALTNYVPVVNYAKSKGLRVLGEPVDSQADTGYTRTQYLQRFSNCVSAFPTIDAWEVGNEVNGDWLSSTIAAKVADATIFCKSQGKPTYLTLFWQLNTADTTFALFNWLTNNLPNSVRTNIDYVALSQYQEQAPMGAFFDELMQRMRVEFPSQQLGLGELGYWVPGQQYWEAYSTTVTTAKHTILEQYYKSVIGYAGANGGCFWWNFASSGSDYDFDATMTNIITDLKNSLLVTNANTLTLTCSSNKTVACGSVWSFDTPGGSTTCSNTNVTVSITSTLTNGTCPQVITRDWLVTDTCGNSNTCSQVVTVEDTNAPTPVCAGNKSVPCNSAWSFDVPTAVDSCSGTNVFVSALNTVTNGSCPQLITRTWVIADPCGNTNTCTQTVMVTNTAPQLTCAGNKTVQCGSVWSFDVPVSAISCGGTNVSVFIMGTTSNGICPQILTRTWLVLDACGGTNMCSQVVTVGNTNPPVIVCTTNKTITPGATWDFDAPTATDFCSGSNATITVLNTLSNGVCPLVATRTWLITDACGNTNTCSQAVTVADIVNPTVIIKSPTPLKQNVTPITVSGTASDNIDVSLVLYRLNGGPWTPASPVGSFTNWTALVTLVAGSNTVQMQSLDGCGNNSTTNSRSYFLMVNSPFTIITNGSGSIASAGSLYGSPVSGAQLQIGRNYAVTAKPAANNVFSNWLSVADGVTNMASTDVRYEFIMESNLTLIANFETNVFVNVAGSYNGLFSDTNNGVAHESAGFVTLKITPASTKPAAFSGHLLLDGETLPFSGRFNTPGDGTPKKPLSRKGKASLTLNLQVPFDGSEKISGTLSNGTDGWHSTITAYQAVFNKTNSPATNFLGSYTVVLPGAVDAAQKPGGDGYGLVFVATNGSVKLTGNLGDGASFKQSTYLSRRGLWPLYAPAYPFKYVYTNGATTRTVGSYAGSTWGWVMVASNMTPGLTGNLSWIKKPGTNDTLYTGGFSNTEALVASFYTNSALAGQRIIQLSNGSNGVVFISDGNLSGPVQDNITLSSVNKFTAHTSDKLKLAITAKTGKLTGSFVNPDNTLVHFYGAVLQNTNSGFGWFKGTNESGSFELQGN